MLDSLHGHPRSFNIINLIDETKCCVYTFHYRWSPDPKFPLLTGRLRLVGGWVDYHSFHVW